MLAMTSLSLRVKKIRFSCDSVVITVPLLSIHVNTSTNRIQMSYNGYNNIKMYNLGDELLMRRSSGFSAEESHKSINTRSPSVVSANNESAEGTRTRPTMQDVAEAAGVSLKTV